MPSRDLTRIPGARLVLHAAAALVVWGLLLWGTQALDPLMNYYLALVAMYATAMFGMTILVGLSGQVSLGNGALMAVGAYVFATVTLNWATVPFTGIAMNGWWAMGLAAVGGVVVGLVIGVLGARLRGPYLAGLTLGVAVGVPAIASRFPELLGGETGLQLTVPYPAGGYAAQEAVADETFVDELPTEQVIEDAPVDELPVDQLSVDQLPVDGAGADDLLTLDDFSSDDVLTLDDFSSEGDSGALTEQPVDELPVDQLTLDGAGADDLLTLDDFSSDDVLTLDDFSSEGDSGALDDVPVEGVPLDDVPLDELPVDASGALPDTGLDGGLDGGFLGLDPDFVLERWQAGLAVTVACLVGFLALNLVRGRSGRQWRAVRDDTVAAAVSGISPARSKVSAFVVSCLFAALAGAVFAQILAYVGPGAFGLGLSLSLLVGVVLGGRSSLLGAVIGAVLLVWLPEFVLRLAGDRGWEDQITNNAPNLIYGLLVVLVVLAAPGGLVGSLQGLVARVRRRP